MVLVKVYRTKSADEHFRSLIRDEMEEAVENLKTYVCEKLERECFITTVREEKDTVMDRNGDFAEISYTGELTAEEKEELMDLIHPLFRDGEAVVQDTESGYPVHSYCSDLEYSVEVMMLFRQIADEDVFYVS